MQVFRQSAAATACFFTLAFAGCAQPPTENRSEPKVVRAAGTDTSFAHSEFAAASPDRIWDVWTDVTGWPRWDIELKTASLGGPFADGAKGQLVPMKGTTSSFVITDVKPMIAYTMTTSLPGASLVIRRELQPVEGGTQFTHTVSFTGPAAGVFGSLFGSRFREALPVAMQRIAQIAAAK